MKTVDAPFGFFWYTAPLHKSAPRLHRAYTYEIEWPYRHSNSFILHFRKEHGLIIGRWKESHDNEDDMLLKILNGRDASEQWEWIKSEQST